MTQCQVMMEREKSLPDHPARLAYGFFETIIEILFFFRKFMKSIGRAVSPATYTLALNKKINRLVVWSLYLATNIPKSINDDGLLCGEFALYFEQSRMTD